MDFALSEEQTLLAASLRRYLTAELPVTRVRELVAKQPGEDGGAKSDHGSASKTAPRPRHPPRRHFTVI